MSNRKFPVGVATGNIVKEIFQYAKESKFAIPAINIIGSNTINAALETAAIMNAPIILQISYGGACFYAGLGITNKANAPILGAKLAALHIHEIAESYNTTVIINTDHCIKKNLKWIDGLIHINQIYYQQYKKTLFSSHMLDLSAEELNDNIKICNKYLKIFKKLNLLLEIEIGVTGGEEDGIDNSHIDNAKLYTQPEDVSLMYENLIKISSNFIIAATFGNVHGVYKPGNVILRPEILKLSQEYIKNKFKTENNPIDFVFHGGSGSSIQDIQQAIQYGVIKMNIDTDLQFAFMNGIKSYLEQKKEYLKYQIGNSHDCDQPNKKYYDPRVWLREGELTFKKRLKQAFKDLNNINTL